MPDPQLAPTSIPPGYGFRRVTPADMRHRSPSDPKRFFDLLLLWERPRHTRRARYILGVDVGDGVGQDRTVCDVLRVGTLEEPAEQVAQYVSDSLQPSQFAYIVAAIGHLYCDTDGVEALAAIETNNHGLSLQDALQNHLGYQHFYRWEYFDAANPAKRFSTRIGWRTTQETRPLMLDKLYEGLTSIDPLTDTADLVVNSPITIEEMWSLYTTGLVGEAEAGRGAHDDCVPPDTLIRTRTGVKPIIDVQIGEEVLTHMGRFRSVTRIGRRPTDLVYDLVITGRRPLTVTGNHRLLVCHRQLRGGKERSAGGTAPVRDHDLPEWLNIDSGIDFTDFSATAVAPSAVVDRETVALIDYAPATYNVVDNRLVAYTYGGTRENVKQARPPAVIAVDEDLCRLMGYYYAEGSRGRHNVGWAAHLDEVNIRAWLTGYLARLGLRSTVIQRSAKGVLTSVGSVPLNGFFAEFGSRDLKQFPEWVTLLPPAKQQHIVMGWLLGDGCFRNANGGITAVTISAFGATQLYEMALRCGWAATLRRATYTQGFGKYRAWNLVFSAHTAQHMRAVVPPALLADKRPLTYVSTVNQTHMRMQHDYLLGHIRSVTPRAYDGLVYNLEVDEDHSYVANGTVVHNCLVALAIANYVGYKLSAGEREPLNDRRRRKHEAYAAAQQPGADPSAPRRQLPDWRNTAVTSDEMHDAYALDEETLDAPIFHDE